MNPPIQPNLIAGQWRTASAGNTIPNLNPFTGDTLSLSSQASAADLESAAQAATHAFQTTRQRPAHARAAILRRAANLLTDRKADIAKLLATESGKPITLSLTEVERGVATVNIAAGEAERLNGDYIPLDALPSGEHHHAYWLREPVGPVLAITPYNFPVNLLLHKLAPAIATGCTVSIKVPPQAPDTPRELARIFVEAGCIPGEINLFDTSPSVAETAVRDPRYKLLSFTGSPSVGWHLKSACGKKRVLLELGNASAAVVHHDAPNLPWIAKRLAFGAFAHAGQVCISVQRIFLHERIAGEFTKLFLAETAAIKTGDPLDPATTAGPMIDDQAASRVASWIAKAQTRGATLLTGGQRSGRFITPAVLANVPQDTELACAEVFGPVVSLFTYGDHDDVFASVNATPFGLQASVFSDSLAFTQAAIDRCEVAAICINESPMYRVDHMPYGGIKDSGLGREGPKYAIEEYTEKKLVLVNRQPA